MMDGRIGAIGLALDGTGHDAVRIRRGAKYASAFMSRFATRSDPANLQAATRKPIRWIAIRTKLCVKSPWILQKRTW